MVEVEAMLNNNKIFRDRMAGHRRDDEGGRDRHRLRRADRARRAASTTTSARTTRTRSTPRSSSTCRVGTTGDCYDRYLVRIEELKQSIRILRQCLKQIPDGPVMVDDPRVALPPKRDTYNTIESMIRHFKHIMDGIKVPAGEAYAFVEGGNGELGFYVVADGTGRPYKAYVPVAVVRPPVDGERS